MLACYWLLTCPANSEHKSCGAVAMGIVGAISKLSITNKTHPVLLVGSGYVKWAELKGFVGGALILMLILFIFGVSRIMHTQFARACDKFVK